MFDKAIEKMGSRFKLTVLLQKRVRELVAGAQPLIKVEGPQSPINIALQEFMQDMVFFDGEVLRRMPIASAEKIERIEKKEERVRRPVGKLKRKYRK